MSGGHFDLKHYDLTELSEAIHDLIMDNNLKHYGNYNDKTI